MKSSKNRTSILGASFFPLYPIPLTGAGNCE